MGGHIKNGTKLYGRAYNALKLVTPDDFKHPSTNLPGERNKSLPKEKDMAVAGHVLSLAPLPEGLSQLEIPED